MATLAFDSRKTKVGDVVKHEYEAASYNFV